MKLLHVEKESCVFELGEAEKELLGVVLGLYPVIPPAHQCLTKSSKHADPARQQLLDEALAEQRRENKKLIAAFLADPKRFVQTNDSLRLRLSAADTEWLLQILNDVRVGSWILLGSPEGKLSIASPVGANAARVSAMALADFFQAGLLEAFNESPPAGD